MNRLLRIAGDPVSAADYNDLVAEYTRRRPEIVITRKPRPFRHPWKVTVARGEDEAQRQWLVRLVPGMVNDQVPSIVYRRVGDPRGWVAPTDYPFALKPGERGYNADLLDRPLHDSFGDPPAILAMAPAEKSGGPGGTTFSVVPAGGRPPFFKTQSMWEKQLYRAYVVVSATATEARKYLQLPITLDRYRVYAVPNQPFAASAEAGGSITLARLFLTREPDNDPAGDQVYIQQIEYFCLWSLVIAPTPVTDGVDAFDNSSGLNEMQINALYQSASRVDAWSV